MFRRIVHSTVLAVLLGAAHVATAADIAVNAPPAPVAPPLTLSINGSVVTISGVSALGKVYVVGLMRTRQLGYTQLSRYQGTLDAAQDGSATLTVRSPIALDSLFFAIDLATGGYGRTAPAGQPVHESPFPDSAAPMAANGQLQKLETHLDVAHLLLVRPGAGAWELTIGDGGPDDDDHTADGASRNRPEQMHPIGSSPDAPKNFRKDDLFFAFDPVNVAMLVLRVKA